MIKQNLAIASGDTISGSDTIPDKRTLRGISFPVMNGTATFIIESTTDGGTSWIEVYTNANALYNPGYTQSKIINLPQEVVSSLLQYRIRVATAQSSARTLVALIQ